MRLCSRTKRRHSQRRDQGFRGKQIFYVVQGRGRDYRVTGSLCRLGIDGLFVPLGRRTGRAEGVLSDPSSRWFFYCYLEPKKYREQPPSYGNRNQNTRNAAGYEAGFLGFPIKYAKYGKALLSTPYFGNLFLLEAPHTVAMSKERYTECSNAGKFLSIGDVEGRVRPNRRPLPWIG